MNRQAWLIKAVDILKYDFWQIGETIPKVEVAWFEGLELSETTMGTCTEKFTHKRGDTVMFITVNPRLNEAVEVLAVLVHELIHAAIGVDHYHDEKFCRVAAAIGLDDGGPTIPAEGVLLERLREISEQLGAYPEIGPLI